MTLSSGPTRPPAVDLATALRVGGTGQLTDAELLARFVAAGRHRDEVAETAFAILVARHGPMVLGVCRRILGGDPHASVDAFQATFLVLVRKAPAVRVDDSLGHWLHGVSLRVATRARTRIRADHARFGPLGSADPPARTETTNDLRLAIDAEVARLPRSLRTAVVLCDLEGLTHAEAARRLRCPVGTVGSRVHRARLRLRQALSRRGFAPTSTLTPPLGRVEVSADLAAMTVALAGRVAATRRWAMVVSPSVSALCRVSSKEWSMIAGWLVPTAWTALALVATGAVGLGDAGQTPPAPTSAPAARADEPNLAPKPTVADQVAQILAEYDRRRIEVRQAQEQAKTQRERFQIGEQAMPDDVVFSRRMIDLAQVNPTDPGARDALLFVLGFRNRDDSGDFGDAFARAASLLIRYHGDDPEAVRVGLTVDNIVSPRRDALLAGLLASAKGREARGLARLSMGQYLIHKAKSVARARSQPGRTKIKLRNALAPDGTIGDREIDEGDERFANRLILAQSDTGYLAAEAERLLKEVIADYGDIPYITVGHREMERTLRQPVPARLGKPLTDAAKDQIRARLADQTTLADVARERLDALLNLAPGRPAPSIEGTGIDGKPLRLADFHGKVVALVFWSSRGDIVTRDLPRYKALAEKYRDQPFALVGVNCDDRKEDAAKTIADNGIAWPNWFDVGSGDGPICRRYHVERFPMMVVIDADGVLQQINGFGLSLDEIMAKRLEALKPEPKPATP